MQLFKNRFIQTVLLGCGAKLLFSTIGYMMFLQAFPIDNEKGKHIKQFEHVRKVRSEYYRNHPHEELNEQ
ncbi:hypothetical protein ABIC59_004597 [Priestia aryabhattai]|uniref:hypothetical protein n=1 Tax=Priestia aryabhattai TaxID=412384 RepID=UPI003392BE00